MDWTTYLTSHKYFLTTLNFERGSKYLPYLKRKIWALVHTISAIPGFMPPSRVGSRRGEGRWGTKEKGREWRGGNVGEWCYYFPTLPYKAFKSPPKARVSESTANANWIIPVFVHTFSDHCDNLFVFYWVKTMDSDINMVRKVFFSFRCFDVKRALLSLRCFIYWAPCVILSTIHST